jgi:hypothetical protein
MANFLRPGRSAICHLESVPAAAHRRQLQEADVFVPEGPDDGSQAWNAWNAPSRSPSRRVRYDRLARGGYRLGWWTNVAPQIAPFPSSVAILAMADKTGRIISALYQAFHAWTSASSVESLPSFRPSGTKVSFLRLTPMRGCRITVALKGRRQPTDLGFHLLRARKWSALGAYCSRTRRDISTSPEDKDRFYEQDIQQRLRTNIHFLSNIRSPWSTHFERSGRNSHSQI